MMMVAICNIYRFFLFLKIIISWHTFRGFESVCVCVFLVLLFEVNWRDWRAPCTLDDILNEYLAWTAANEIEMKRSWHNIL